ncbi:unnamed protein product [Victoria cruziana]
MIFCGRASVADSDEELRESCHSLPKKSTKRDKNPFSSRGLDKFASVSSELHSRAQKVLSQLGAAPTDNIIIRFAYSGSNGWTPVVVRPRKAAAEGGGAMKPANPAKKSPGSVEKTGTNKEGGRHGDGPGVKGEMGMGPSQRLATWFGLRQVEYFWHLAMVVALVCLLVFGRLAAVVCITIWLYFLASFFAADCKQHAANGRKKNKGVAPSDQW